jgi:hypothetical protein
MKLDQRLLDDLEAELLKLSTKYSGHDFIALSDSNTLFKGMGYEILGIGESRTVYRTKYSRKVFKVCSNLQNIAEYALYKALEDSPLSNLLAKSYLLSNKGHILVQEYFPRVLPECYAYDATTVYYDPRDDFIEFEDFISNIFDFVFRYSGDANVECDLHESNFGVNRKGEIKIIDYAAILTASVNYKDFKLDACIRELSRYNKVSEGEYSIRLDAQSNVVASTPTNRFVLPKKLKYAQAATA